MTSSQTCPRPAFLPVCTRGRCQKHAQEMKFGSNYSVKNVQLDPRAAASLHSVLIYRYKGFYSEPLIYGGLGPGLEFLPLEKIQYNF